MRSEYFFSFTVSSLLGVAIETIGNFGYSLGILFIFLSIATLLPTMRGANVRQGFIVSLVLLGCAVGSLAVDVSTARGNIHPFCQFVVGVVSVKGIVSAEPDAREMNTNVVLETESIARGGDNVLLPQAVNILVHVPSYPSLRYGDEIVVTGKIIVPPNIVVTPGERPFDYQAYLAKDGIYYEMSFAKVDIVNRGKGNWLLGKLLDLKQLLMNNIAFVIPEPEASLGGGIVLGTKQSLGKDWIQKFRDSGLAHIVVLSGYNIAVVASVIGRMVIFLPFTARLLSSAAGIILFALMVGGGATVLRATLMALVVILARAMGRESDALRILIFVGWLMVLTNPTILLYDVSFQLSFFAALSLVLLAPNLDKYFLFIKNGVMREILVTTVSTQIYVAPLLLYHMGTFSLVGLVANLFVLPTIPLAMFLVTLVSIFASIPLVGVMLGLPTQFLLAYILHVAQIGAQVHFATIRMSSFGIIALVISYAIIFIFSYAIHSAADVIKK